MRTIVPWIPRGAPWWRRGERIEASLGHVRHGDAAWFTCHEPGSRRPGEFVVRLARIKDCDEHRGEYNRRTAGALALAKLLAGKIVTIVPRRAWPDQYGRMIAEVMVDGLNASDELLRLGVVARFVTYRRGAACTGKR